VNTPDILHATLQQGGPPAFRLRAVLAAITCPSWGMYSGYELSESARGPGGSEEYLDSEKYQLRPRDWSSPASLAPFITRLNEIRNGHRDAIAQIEHPSAPPHDRRLDALCLAVHSRQGGCDHPRRQPGPHHPREASTWLISARWASPRTGRSSTR